jgi:hypothetical protein
MNEGLVIQFGEGKVCIASRYNATSAEIRFLPLPRAHKVGADLDLEVEKVNALASLKFKGEPDLAVLATIIGDLLQCIRHPQATWQVTKVERATKCLVAGCSNATWNDTAFCQKCHENIPIDTIDSNIDKTRLLRKVDEQGDIIQGDDGYYVFWPKESHGALSPWMLRAIADELDRRNEPWDKIIQTDPAIGGSVKE